MKSFVVIVRHPDYGNEVTIYEGTDVGVDYIDVDLGSSFDGVPDSREQWEEWSDGMLADVAELPFGHGARTQINALVTELEPKGDA